MWLLNWSKFDIHHLRCIDLQRRVVWRGWSSCKNDWKLAKISKTWQKNSFANTFVFREVKHSLSRRSGVKSEYRAKLKNISDLQYCVLWSAIDVAAQGRCSGIEVAIVISHLVYKRMEFRKEYGYFSISIYCSVSRHLHLLHVYITLPYVLLNRCFFGENVSIISGRRQISTEICYFFT